MCLSIYVNTSHTFLFEFLTVKSFRQRHQQAVYNPRKTHITTYTMSTPN